MFLFVELLGILVVLGLAWSIFERIRYRNFPPGPRGLPVVGSFFSIREDIHEYFTRLSKEYGDVVFTKIGSVEFVVLSDWKSIQETFAEKDKELAARPSSFIWKIAMKNTGISADDGPRWQNQKRLATRQIKHGFPMLEEKLATQVQKLIGILQENDGRQVCISDLFFVPVFNIILKFLTGQDHFSKEKTDFLQTNMHEAFLYGGIGYWLNNFPSLRFFLDYKRRHATVRNHTHVENSLAKDIESHMKHQDADSPPNDFIDAYLSTIFHNWKNEDALELQAMKSTCASIVYATDSLETTLIFAFLYLAMWPEIQRKVQHEIDEVVGRSRAPTYSDHTVLPYTHATILETHRFCSVLPLLLPHATVKKTELLGYTLPKGVTILFNIYAVNFDKKLWGDPEVFRPERFLDANGQVARPEYLMTFSKGLRGCPGRQLADIQIFVFLASLLQRFSFHQATEDEPLVVETATGITRKPKQFHLLVKQRLS